MIPFRQAVAGLSFPTGVTFDDAGTIYIAESGLPFGGAVPGGRILEVRQDGIPRVIRDQLRPPVNGVTWFEGSLYISEGGHPARISRLDSDGRFSVVLEGLPGPGNYHTNMVAFSPDGWLYFSQGAMTNTGIVGLDAYELGWLRRLPHAHDVPGYEIVLSGESVETPDPLAGGLARAHTGAFAQFGSGHGAGTVIPAHLPATAAVMRCRTDGRDLELVAWGLRNAYGLGFLPDGRLLATDQGADDRGSRPVGNAPDLLFDVHSHRWYGWPDFIGAVPITDARYRPTRGPSPQFLLTNHMTLPAPEPPLLSFPPHCGALKFDCIPDPHDSSWRIVVALFGDEAPMTAPSGPRVGRTLAVIDPADWSLHDFGDLPLHRPIDVRYEAQRQEIYVLDFGEFEMTADSRLEARDRTGRLLQLPAAALEFATARTSAGMRDVS